MRLVTRSDFDGLVCAVFLKELGLVNEVVFAHPKDMQDGTVSITGNDIITNLPFNENCGMWFDHHASEGQRVDLDSGFKGMYSEAPSAARVVYDYYNDAKLKKFEKLLVEVDKSDAATLSMEDVLNPTGWILLSYVMDPRTGLGKFHNFTISNRDLMFYLIDWIRTHSVDEILAKPEIKERVEKYFEDEKAFEAAMHKYSKVEGNVIVTDLRDAGDVPTGNRFKVYALFPSANIQARIHYGKGTEIVVVALGHSIFNRTSKTHVGTLMAKYGGGGHKGAGTCQLSGADIDKKIREIIETCKKDG